MTVYGYGNWAKITKEFNKTMNDNYFGKINQCVIRTSEGIRIICTWFILFYTVES